MMELPEAARHIATMVAKETSFPKQSDEYSRVHYGASRGFALAVPLAINAEADRIAKWLEAAAIEILARGMGNGEIDLTKMEYGVAVIEFVAEAIRIREHRNG